MFQRIVAWVAKHPDIKQWLHAHPRTVGLARARLTLKNFFGLPLTVIGLLMIVYLLGLAGIFQDYLAQDPLVAADVRIANLLFAFRSVAGVHVFYAITSFASLISGAVVMAVCIVALVWRKRWVHGLTALVGFVGAEGVTAVLKLLFHRTRPDLLLRAISEDSFSLPSGHATTAAFVFGYLGYLLFLRFKGKLVRVLAVCAVVLAVVLIDVSRLYLGVHYASDVLAGNAIGFFALFVVVIADQWIAAKKKIPMRPLPLVVIVGAFVALLFSAAMVLTRNQSPWTAPIATETQTIAASDTLRLFTSGALPTHTETLIGEPQEPVSIILIVPDACVESNFAKAGWTRATTIEPSTLYRSVKAALWNSAYLSAPMTPSFYHERPHDFGFEKQTAVPSVRQRHHARFWETSYTTSEGRVMVGTASLDTGIKWGVTHAIAPDIDTERDTLVSDLVASGVVNSQETVRHFVDPVLGQNFASDFFFTNGDAMLLKLASCSL